MNRRLVPFLNWINLSTPCGLAVAALSGCRVSRGPYGILLAEGYRRRLPKARAFTVGSVVLLRGTAPSRAPAAFLRLLEHEARHTRQYAACLGLPFLPAYVVAAGYSLLRTGDPASRNLFERGAGLRDGGYREGPTRPLGAVVRVSVRASVGAVAAAAGRLPGRR
ncbi:eCIS core domain-containing protein [Arthrobacter sp. TMS1-12-1]